MRKKKIDKESSKKEYNDRNSIRIDASSVKEVEKKKSCC